jgi:hypothetical protein
VEKINKYSISVRDVNRVKEDYMDWCEAPVESEYFMYVNSYFHVRKYVDLLITKDEKPLVSLLIYIYFIYFIYIYRMMTCIMIVTFFFTVCAGCVLSYICICKCNKMQQTINKQ